MSTHSTGLAERASTPVAPSATAGSRRDHGIRAASGARFVGVLTGALVGAVLFLPLGFVPWGDGVGAALRFATVVAIGVLIGASLGAVYWSEHDPVLEAEPGDETSEHVAR